MIPEENSNLNSCETGALHFRKRCQATALQTNMPTPIHPVTGFENLPVTAVFLGRTLDVDVATDRATALANLAPHHAAAIARCGFDDIPLATAEQVHGDNVAVVSNDVRPAAARSACSCRLHTSFIQNSSSCNPRQDTLRAAAGRTPLLFEGADALITNLHGICLGIYVADCAAVCLYDPVRRAIGLVHSGKKGTELKIVPKTIAAMNCEYGCLASDIVASISPCIRPPHYEVDFAATIRTQLAESGVKQIYDEQICTFSHPEKYYSYRRERGLTGRMLALLAIR